MVALAKPKLDFQPVRDFLLVKPLPMDETETDAGIIIPNLQEDDGGKRRPQKGRVIAAGPGRMHDVAVGELAPMICSVGEVIYLGSPYANPIEVWLAGETYLVVRDRDVVAKATAAQDD